MLNLLHELDRPCKARQFVSWKTFSTLKKRLTLAFTKSKFTFPLSCKKYEIYHKVTLSTLTWGMTWHLLCLYFNTLHVACNINSTHILYNTEQQSCILESRGRLEKQCTGSTIHWTNLLLLPDAGDLFRSHTIILVLLQMSDLLAALLPWHYYSSVNSNGSIVLSQKLCDSLLCLVLYSKHGMTTRFLRRIFKHLLP